MIACSQGVFFNIFDDCKFEKLNMTSLVRRFLLISISMMFIMEIVASNKHEIKIMIDGYQDSALLLTSYYGKKIKLVDTAYSIRSGVFIFSGERNYRVVFIWLLV